MGAQRITRHEGARYKVMGVDYDLWETLTHLRYTCEHVRFFQPNVRGEAKTAICATTALLTPADSPKSAHSPVRIVLSTQRPSLEPCRSASVVAHTARCPTASKPAQQPVRGESRNPSPTSAKVTSDGARDHGMDHTDGAHHASALKPQPRAAIPLQPP